MNFRAAARRVTADSFGMAEDDSADPTNMAGNWSGDRSDWQPGVDTDGQDPATPGGPAPYNAEEPTGNEPVTSDPLWKDPAKPEPLMSDMPHIQGPNQEAQTLHNARRARYAAMERVR